MLEFDGLGFRPCLYHSLVVSPCCQTLLRPRTWASSPVGRGSSHRLTERFLSAGSMHRIKLKKRVPNPDPNARSGCGAEHVRGIRGESARARHRPGGAGRGSLSAAKDPERNGPGQLPGEEARICDDMGGRQDLGRFRDGESSDRTDPATWDAAGGVRRGREGRGGEGRKKEKKKKHVGRLP